MEDRSHLKVVIGSEVALYSQKGYVQSGQSAQGVLVLDTRVDKVQCHECGEWFASLPDHIWRVHQMKIRAYKIKHGLPQKSALCNERIRGQLVDHGYDQLSKRGAEIRAAASRGVAARLSARATRGGTGPSYACRNRRERCHAQLLTRLKKLAATLGRNPSHEELKRADLHPSSLVYLFHLPLREIFSLAGLTIDVKPVYTRELLAEMLRDFYVKRGRLPSGSDYRRGAVPSRNVFRKFFGSLNNAFFAAGLESVAANRSKMYRVEQLEDMMREYMRRTGAFPSQSAWDNGDVGLPTRKTFRRYIPDLVSFVARIKAQPWMPPGVDPIPSITIPLPSS